MKTIPSLIVLVAAALLPATLHAQDDGARSGMKATAVVGEAGLSNDSTHNNGWFGGMALWQPTHRVGIAVSARWLDAGPAASAVATDISTELGLLPRSSRQMPYVRLGVGAYRATFDLADARQAATMPDFYYQRVDFVSTVRNRTTFMDPMFVAGVGIDVPLNKRVSIRPDVRGMWVVRDGHAYQMVLIGVQLAYHIEAHRVTPSISPR
jgi:Outer membrane protein beta-barrel domain